MGEADRIRHTGTVPPPWPKEDQEAFLSFAADKLGRLRPDAVDQSTAMGIEELCYTMHFWEGVVPEDNGSVLQLIFQEFPSLAEEFDPGVTQRNLGTGENLALLLEDRGAVKVADEFLRYFAARWGRRWRVLIPPANLASVTLPPVEVVPGIAVELRGMQDEEWQCFHEHGLLEQRPADEEVFFAVTVHAGDEKAVLRKAHRGVEQYLAPYYLHAMRLEQEAAWYVVRPERVRLLSKELLCPANRLDGLGIQVNLERMRTPAQSIVQQQRQPDAEWVNSIREIISQWHSGSFSAALDGHLALATKWMFSAESEEAPENAYLKHCVAWEALFPTPKKHAALKRGLWLLILALHSQDVWSLRTVSQAKRLLDRRNSLAHPEPAGGLTTTLEQDLRTLKRALWSAHESVLAVRGLQTSQGAQDTTWSSLLSGLVGELGRVHEKWGRGRVAPENLTLMDALGLCDQDGHLTENGQAARVEAGIVQALLCWDDQERSVGRLAHAFHLSMRSGLPHSLLHAALCVQKRKATSPGFAEAWGRSGVHTQAPDDQQLSQIIAEVHRDHGIRPEAVGWR